MYKYMDYRSLSCSCYPCFACYHLPLVLRAVFVSFLYCLFLRILLCGSSVLDCLCTLFVMFSLFSRWFCNSFLPLHALRMSPLFLNLLLRLNLQSRMVCMCTVCCNTKNCVELTQCIYVFCTSLAPNSVKVSEQQ
jgi:hypothetical protein